MSAKPGSSSLRDMRQITHDLYCRFDLLTEPYKPLARSLRALRNNLEQADDVLESCSEDTIWAVQTQIAHTKDVILASLRSIEEYSHDRVKGSKNNEQRLAQFIQWIDLAAQDIASVLAAFGEERDSLGSSPEIKVPVRTRSLSNRGMLTPDVGGVLCRAERCSDDAGCPEQQDNAPPDSAIARSSTPEALGIEAVEDEQEHGTSNQVGQTKVYQSPFPRVELPSSDIDNALLIFRSETHRPGLTDRASSDTMIPNAKSPALSVNPPLMNEQKPSILSAEFTSSKDQRDIFELDGGDISFRATVNLPANRSDSNGEGHIGTHSVTDQTQSTVHGRHNQTLFRIGEDEITTGQTAVHASSTSSLHRPPLSSSNSAHQMPLPLTSFSHQGSASSGYVDSGESMSEPQLNVTRSQEMRLNTLATINSLRKRSLRTRFKYIITNPDIDEASPNGSDSKTEDDVLPDQGSPSTDHDHVQEAPNTDGTASLLTETELNGSTPENGSSSSLTGAESRNQLSSLSHCQEQPFNRSVSSESMPKVDMDLPTLEISKSQELPQNSAHLNTNARYARSASEESWEASSIDTRSGLSESRSTSVFSEGEADLELVSTVKYPMRSHFLPKSGLLRYRRKADHKSKMMSFTSRSMFDIPKKHIAVTLDTHPTESYPADETKAAIPRSSTEQALSTVLSAESVSTKESHNASHPVMDSESDIVHTRQHILVRLWNEGSWSSAKDLLKIMFDDVPTDSNRALTRRLSHLLGIVASIQGEWHDALNHFIHALDSPLTSPASIDAGDCAAAYWLGDTYAMLGRKSEALLAYCIAEHGPTFQGSEGYVMHQHIRAEQRMCQLGGSKSEFQLEMDRKMQKRESVAFGTILDTDIVTAEAADQFLRSVSWPPETHNLNPNQSRADVLWGEYAKLEDLHENNLLRLDESAFSSTAIWPIPFDPFMALANVFSNDSSNEKGDLLTIANDASAAKTIPRAPAFSRKNIEGITPRKTIESITSLNQITRSIAAAKTMVKAPALGLKDSDSFTCHEQQLTWMIEATRDCLTSLGYRWSETPTSRPPGFLVSYETVEDGIATAHSTSLSLFRLAMRSGYKLELCPDGISSARILRTNVGFDKGVDPEKVKQVRKSIREYLEAAREAQDATESTNIAPPVMGVNGAISSGMHTHTSSSSSSSFFSRPAAPSSSSFVSSKQKTSSK